MLCSFCKQDTATVDAIGNCKACHVKKLQDISLRLQSIENNILYWIQEVERRYKGSIFYSEDLPLNFGPARDTGKADGFLATGKNFKIRETTKPSKAIRDFIQGSQTICECQGLIVAVMYNSLLDVLSIPVFDVVFRDLEITTDISGVKGAIAPLLRQVAANSDDGVSRGDWIYILNTDVLCRLNLVQSGHASAAAGGWNLICVEAGAEKLYMGLGLADAAQSVSAFTLASIKRKMLGLPEPQPTAPVRKSAEELKKMFASGGRLDLDQPKSKPKLGTVQRPEDIQVQRITRINRQKVMTLVKAKLAPESFGKSSTL